MQVLVADHSHKDQWDDFVYQTPNLVGTISWHIFDWYTAYAGHHPVEYIPIMALEAGEVQGILPLYRVKTLRTGDMLISIPYFVAGGIVAQQEGAKQLILEKAIDVSRQLGDVPIVLKQYGIPTSHDSLVTDTTYFNRELDLSVGVEEIWHNLAECNKARVSSSEERAMTLEYPSQDVDSYYRLLAKHQHRTGVPAPSKGWIRSLLAHMYEVALLKLGGRAVAATLVKQFKGSVSFPLTALSSDFAEGQTFGYRLYWELLKRQIDSGICIYHSGRTPEDESVPAYRLGWGGKRHGYYYQYYGYTGGTEGQNKRSRKRELFEAVWKRVPRLLSGLVNPLIVRQFP